MILHCSLIGLPFSIYWLRYISNCEDRPTIKPLRHLLRKYTLYIRSCFIRIPLRYIRHPPGASCRRRKRGGRPGRGGGLPGDVIETRRLGYPEKRRSR